MSAVLMKDRLPSDVRDTDTYNRVQMRRAVQARRDQTGKTPYTAGELLRVLVVDDNRDSADVTSMLVSAWGHDVRRAYDGVTGLALTAAYQPDIVLLDIIMPGLSGLELALKVRQQARFEDCFLIAVTGCTDAGIRKQCADAGIDLFLIKPLDPSILHALLIWEARYRLRTRPDTATNHELPIKLQQQTDPNSPRPTLLPCSVSQGIVASKRGC